MMTATEVTLKSPSVPLFQRENFLHWTLTPLWKACPEPSRREAQGRELFGELRGRTLARLLKKISEAKRAKDRRAEAYSASTLERGDRAQRRRMSLFQRRARSD